MAGRGGREQAESVNTTPEDFKTREGERGSAARRLRRPTGGRIVAGVATGIARYADVDVTFVRIAFVVLTIIGFTGLPFFGWLPLYLLGIPLYLACWLLIPEEGSEQSIAGAMLHRLQGRSR
jgi:phage shock protein PspC (stress-responsive transcriptional regulator)